MTGYSHFGTGSVAFAARRFAARLRRAIQNPGDPENIHDLRVSIRRYTQCLRTFKDLLDPKYVKRVRKRLRRLMTLCGETRNCDIAQDVLRAAGIVQKNPAHALLRSRRGKAERNLVRHLEKKRWTPFIAGHSPQFRSDALQHPGPRGPSAAAIAAALLPQLCEDFFRTGAAAIGGRKDYQALHQFRLCAKRFRYSLEIFEPVYGKGPRESKRLERKLKDLRGLQDCLGEINDCLTTLELVGGKSAVRSGVRKLLALREARLQAYWQRHFAVGKSTSWMRWLAAPSATK